MAGRFYKLQSKHTSNSSFDQTFMHISEASSFANSIFTKKASIYPSAYINAISINFS